MDVSSLRDSLLFALLQSPTRTTPVMGKHYRSSSEQHEKTEDIVRAPDVTQRRRTEGDVTRDAIKRNFVSAVNGARGARMSLGTIAKEIEKNKQKSRFLSVALKLDERRRVGPNNN